jgi:hypothetical protein
VGTGGVLAANVATVLVELMCNVRSYLTADHEGAGTETDESRVYLNRVLVAHSTLSVLNEKLVFKGNQANGGIGRVDEYRRGALMEGWQWAPVGTDARACFRVFVYLPSPHAWL